VLLNEAPTIPVIDGVNLVGVVVLGKVALELFKHHLHSVKV